jgi:hypothetical protein
MTKEPLKEPELQIKTTFSKFAGFLKALALIATIAGTGAGSTYLTSSSLSEVEVIANNRRDSLINVLQNDVKTHDIRIFTVEGASQEIKTQLIDIQKDIKTLLYISGKNEGRYSR